MTFKTLVPRPSKKCNIPVQMDRVLVTACKLNRFHPGAGLRLIFGIGTLDDGKFLDLDGVPVRMRIDIGQGDDDGKFRLTPTRDPRLSFALELKETAGVPYVPLLLNIPERGYKTGLGRLECEYMCVSESIGLIITLPEILTWEKMRA